jgi:hypothetical protein
MTHEFDATLCRLEGKIAWTVLYVPFSVPDTYGTNGRVNVSATLDGHTFAATLLPSRNGHYLAFNQAMKAATGKALGDTVHVVLAPDTAPRGVEVPDEIRAALDGQDGAREAFNALPPYIQRAEIGRITDAKTEPTRQKRLSGLLERLRGPGG